MDSINKDFVESLKLKFKNRIAFKPISNTSVQITNGAKVLKDKILSKENCDIPTPRKLTTNLKLGNSISIKKKSGLLTLKQQKVDTSVSTLKQQKVDTSVSTLKQQKVDTSVSTLKQQKVDTSVSTLKQQKVDTSVSTLKQQKVDASINVSAGKYVIKHISIQKDLLESSKKPEKLSNLKVSNKVFVQDFHEASTSNEVPSSSKTQIPRSNVIKTTTIENLLQTPGSGLALDKAINKKTTRIMNASSTENDRNVHLEIPIKKNTEMTPMELVLRELAILRANSDLQAKMLQQLTDPAEQKVKGIPIQSDDDLNLIEERLQEPKFKLSLISYFRKKNPARSKKFTKLLKFVASDTFLYGFNYDGGYQRRAFKTLLLNEVLLDAWGNDLGERGYEKEMRLATHMVRNRFTKTKRSRIAST